MFKQIIPQPEFVRQARSEFLDQFSKWKRDSRYSIALERAEHIITSGHVMQNGSPTTFEVAEWSSWHLRHTVDLRQNACPCSQFVQSGYCAHYPAAWIASRAQAIERKTLDQDEQSDALQRVVRAAWIAWGKDVYQDGKPGWWTSTTSHTCGDKIAGRIMGNPHDPFCGRCGERYSERTAKTDMLAECDWSPELDKELE